MTEVFYTFVRPPVALTRWQHLEALRRLAYPFPITPEQFQEVDYRKCLGLQKLLLGAEESGMSVEV